VPADRPQLFASVSTAASGVTPIVAANASNRIKVVSYCLIAAGAVNVKWQSAANDLTGAMPFAANGGAAPTGSDDAPLLQTNVNEALNLNLSAAVQVSGHISYYLEP
jgi:hypothetical protein